MSKSEVLIDQKEEGRRRRFTAEQKRALLDDATRPGGSVSETARRYGIAPSLLFKWKHIMDDASKSGLKANERVVPESEVNKLKARIRELERTLGKKTMENEILQEAVEIARQKQRSWRGNSSGGSDGR